jgi:RNA polymerase-binding transcription factor DksA
MSTLDTDRFRDALQEERARVVAALEYLDKENPGSIEEEGGEETGSDNHLGDSATITLDREIDDTLEENSQEVLRAIDGALKRIEDGTYGKCRVCGKDISEERLEAMPWVDLCIDDARKEQA